MLAGAGALLIPGVGPIIAAGPLAAFLTGVVGASLAAALLILVSLKKEAGILKRVKEGDILVTIKASNDEVPEIASILEDNGLKM